MVSPPRRTSVKRPPRNARGALRTTRSCRKKSRRRLPTRSTRRLGRKRKKNDRFNSESYTTQSRTPKVRNVGGRGARTSIVARALDHVAHHAGTHDLVGPERGTSVKPRHLLISRAPSEQLWEA